MTAKPNPLPDVPENTGASADAETGSREPGLAARPGPSGFDPARIAAACEALDAYFGKVPEGDWDEHVRGAVLLVVETLK